jgi:transcription antitermination factor NusA-like protein
MIRTVVTPENQNLSIHIPADYIGREVEVLLYAVDELKQPEKMSERKKPSDFKGLLKLTDKEYEDFQNHLKNIRNEWDRDI